MKARRSHEASLPPSFVVLTPSGCRAQPTKISICLGSDGSQQEGDDYEAAILAVAQNLPVKLIIDDNDVTIAGHPSSYLKGYDVVKKLEGQV